MERERLEQAVPHLLAWYRLFKRDLPWRKDKDPYHVWVSEIMLQQTRVEAVKGYYVRFLEKFPTVSALAAAPEDEVLKAWEGMGYYSRARNLHRAAKLIAEQGAFPDSFEEIRALPGVGDYTAGAICSIAYDLPYPAVDGNVLRVLTRLLADPSPIGEAATKERFTEALRAVYPSEAGDFAQALMELGALVCLPNGTPLCDRCPWRELCLAHAAGEEERYPVRAEKKAREKIPVSVYVLQCGDEFALERRNKKGLLAGLWQFPLVEGKEEPPFSGEVIAKKSAVHIFTHKEWHMTGYLVRVLEKSDDYVWATAEEIGKNFALPSALKAFFEWLK